MHFRDFGQDDEVIRAPTLYVDPVSVPEVLREPSPRAPTPATFIRSPEVLRESVQRGLAKPAQSNVAWLALIGFGAIVLITRR